MGLDMYLNKSRFVWDREKEKLSIRGIKGIDSNKVKYIVEEAMYWRKSNHIHKWFVDNVQDGKDDCGEYDVSKEKLESLLNCVNAVLKDRNRAQELLPTQQGFFFGGTDFDEYYFKDLKKTKEGLEYILKNWDDDFDFCYRSSW